MSIERLKKVWRDIAYKVSKEVLHDTYEGDLFKTYYLLNRQLFKHFIGNELTSLSFAIFFATLSVDTNTQSMPRFKLFFNL